MYTKSLKDTPIRLLLWFVWLILGLLATVTASAQNTKSAYSNEFSIAEREALYDSLALYQTLKPKAQACDSALKAANGLVAARNMELLATRVGWTLTKAQDSVRYEKREKVALKKSYGEGYRKGFIHSGIIITGILILKTLILFKP